jgi:hypothetical protein
LQAVVAVDVMAVVEQAAINLLLLNHLVLLQIILSLSAQVELVL